MTCQPEPHFPSSSGWKQPELSTRCRAGTALCLRTGLLGGSWPYGMEARRGVSLTGCPCFSRLPPGPDPCCWPFLPTPAPFCFGGSCRLCLFAGRGLVKTWEEVGGDGTSPALQPCGPASTSVTAVPPPRAGPARCLRVLICKMMMVLVPEFILVASGGNQLLLSNILEKRGFVGRTRRESWTTKSSGGAAIGTALGTLAASVADLLCGSAVLVRPHLLRQRCGSTSFTVCPASRRDLQESRCALHPHTSLVRALPPSARTFLTALLNIRIVLSPLSFACSFSPSYTLPASIPCVLPTYSLSPDCNQTPPGWKPCPLCQCWITSAWHIVGTRQMLVDWRTFLSRIFLSWGSNSKRGGHLKEGWCLRTCQVWDPNRRRDRCHLKAILVWVSVCREDWISWCVTA